VRGRPGDAKPVTAGLLRIRALDLVTGHASRGLGRVRWSPARGAARGPAAWDVREEGMWRSGPFRGAPFRGAYRWERTASGLVVSHLRGGADVPALLARLVPAGDDHAPAGALVAGLTSRAPHVCGADRYDLFAIAHRDGVALHWTIRGPRKRIELGVLYAAPIPRAISPRPREEGGR